MQSRRETAPTNTEFEELTFPCMEQLFRLAYTRTGNTQDAEDLVQETYIKAFRAFATVRQTNKIKSWLTNILVNTIRDYHRKSLRTVDTIDISDLDHESIQEHRMPGPEEQMCQNEIDPALGRALQTIPDTFLAPLLLREIQDASYDEIAQTLDIPIGTVMSRLSRARAMLRTKLTANTTTPQMLYPHGNKGIEDLRQ